MAIAVIAASIADPIAELLSNAGVFGAGRYTDHSNLDVFPALTAGLALLALYFVRKAPAILCSRALSGGIASTWPTIFILQLATLYLMETGEQWLVWGHPLGSTIWLGAPPAISLTIHALAGLTVLLFAVRSSRALASTTLRLIRLIRAIATFALAAPRTVRLRLPYYIALRRLLAALRAVGERAPPCAMA